MKYILKINNMYLYCFGTDNSAIKTSFVSYIEFTYEIIDSYKITTKEKAQQLADILSPLLGIKLDVVEYKEGEE